MEEKFVPWSHGALGMTFSVTRGRFTIFKNTIEKIGYPEYYRFLFNPEQKKFAIQSCNFGDCGADRMPELNSRDCCWISSLGLLRYIFKTCAWNPKYAHRAEGVYYPEQNLVEFDLENAWELHENRMKVSEEYIED